MTGVELLKEKLIKEYGCNKNQVESKLFSCMLSALSEDRSYIRLYEVKEQIGEHERQLKEVIAKYKNYNIELQGISYVYKDLQGKYRNLKEQYKAYEYYAFAEKKYDEISCKIDSFLEALNNGETDEGRDALRKAQFFVQYSDVRNDANNTAFINGLAMILSCGKFPQFNGLEKIETDKEKIKGEKK